MTTVSIRGATHDDLPAILDIYNDAILTTTAVYSEKPHTLATRRQWYKERMENNFPVFVAENDSDIVGFSSFGHFRAWPCYRYTVEISVYVQASQRGKGIGKLLIEPLITRARQMNMHALIAGISADNEISLKLHKNFGFTEVAHFKAVGYKFGRWLDLKFLELMLDNEPGPLE
jgi:L-amino acid N-acyltransferase